MKYSLTLIHLYPHILNLYGDRGNIITLHQRCAWRGIELDVAQLGLRDRYERDGDLLFIGGDQDREQQVVAADLSEVKGDALRGAVEAGIPLLAVCGGYQLLQHSYRSADGEELEGLGIFDAHTVHPGLESDRCIGNIVISWNGDTLVGFENHGGRTYLGPNVRPLGTVISGFGNNGKDSTEGAVSHQAYGTYMHGSLLPKNPALADHLISLALQRKYGQLTLEPLDDSLEQLAHESATNTAAPRRSWWPLRSRRRA